MKNIPDATRIIEGLRDTGYTFNSAIADIIDNCISHGQAKNVWLDIEMDYVGEISLSITDDGTGMNETGLINAMKYGSENLSNPESLGKFGMGMKTASSAFCRRYSLISRDEEKNTFKKLTWDLDHVCEVNDWDMLQELITESESEICNKYLEKRTGTIVYWEKIDRLMRQYDSPGGKFAQNALKKKIDELEFHLSMVYQQFIDSKCNDFSQINIEVNNKIIEPWDPFCEHEENSQMLAHDDNEMEDEDGNKIGDFSVSAYSIPDRYNFSTDESLKNARLSNSMQGIYVYRHGRLISHGSWLGIRALEPHFTLSRVKLCFDYKMDEIFQIDLKKSRILLNEGLIDWLKDFLSAPVRETEKRYRKGKKKGTQADSKGAHHDSNVLISNKEEDISQSSKNVIDENTGETEITNKEGKTRIVLKIVQPETDNELHILTVPSLENGVLWEPSVHDGKTAVLLNTSHVFYDRVYVPNHNESVTIQGLDAFLWSLAESEYSTFNEKTKKSFETLRYEVSKILRELASDLPES